MIRCSKSSQSGQSSAAGIISASNVTGASRSRVRATAATARRPISNALPSSPIHGPYPPDSCRFARRIAAISRRPRPGDQNDPRPRARCRLQGNFIVCGDVRHRAWKPLGKENHHPPDNIAPPCTRESRANAGYIACMQARVLEGFRGRIGY